MGGFPDQFFSSTPRMVGIVMEGRARAAKARFQLLAWQTHTAACLERVKRIPPLDTLIGGKDRAPRLGAPRSAEDLLSLARRWQAVLPPGEDRTSAPEEA